MDKPERSSERLAIIKPCFGDRGEPRTVYGVDIYDGYAVMTVAYEHSVANAKLFLHYEYEEYQLVSHEVWEETWRVNFKKELQAHANYFGQGVKARFLQTRRPGRSNRSGDQSHAGSQGVRSGVEGRIPGRPRMGSDSDADQNGTTVAREKLPLIQSGETEDTLIAPVAAAKRLNIPPQYLYNAIKKGRFKTAGERPKMVRLGDLAKYYRR